MTKQKTILAAAGLVVTALAAALVLFFQIYWRPLQEGSEKKEAMKQVAIEEEILFRQAFEANLNQMLEAVAQHMEVYKRQRIILNDFIAPRNLRSPEYVQENYRLMLSAITMLRGRMDEIMQIFEITGRSVKALAEQRGQKTEREIEEQWVKLEREQINAYIDFFEKEERVLEAYQQLMAFYFLKQNNFTYDEASEQLVFENEEDEAQEAVYLEAIRQSAESPQP